ncbi:MULTISPECIES: DeoR/GlpR family DNA-binding transcription regulator [unclassified Enterococcus]|uniref:DeoR/GlpR family DNA-binding transcription regulator n=1 Tax=unclassified Enterococcus TaxID=2608891 RepID=UPI0013EE34DF|nr:MULTISPECIES: DeoR/GlpR family DNA-binding transcription regulator [unclassified Enterococcus]
MLKKERQERILTLLEEDFFLTNTEIANKLGVSEMTIRRDVTELANNQKVKKLYGGVERKEPYNRELSTQEKIDTNVEEKKYIGQIMNSIIQDHSTIYVGAGTTILYALPFIQKKNLFVITNSLIAFNYLKNHTQYRILLTGGEFSPVTEEFIGEVAERSFERLNVDISFAATNGIFENNVTTAQFIEGGIQNAALNAAKIKCVVADYSKLNKSDIYTFRNLSEFDYLITDNKISDEDFNHYSKYTKLLKEPKNDHYDYDESIH